MGEDFIKREEYREGMERLHERIDGIATSATEIKIAAQYIRESSTRLHEAVFGNGKPGALHRILQAWGAINFQWWVLGGVLTVMGTMIFVFITHLSK